MEQREILLPRQGIAVTPEGHRSSYFGNIREAVDKCAGINHALSYDFRIPTETKINAELEGNPRGLQVVTLTLGDRTVRVPRASGESPGVGIQTDRSLTYPQNIIVTIGEYTNQIIDRGLTWVTVNDQDQSYVTLRVLKDHELPNDALAEMITHYERTATKYVGDVLSGKLRFPI